MGPRRLLAGKLSALWIATTAALALASAGCVAAAAITASKKGIDTSLWWTSSGFSHTAVAVANLAAATLGWGLLGAVLGIAFRSPAAAVGIGVAYALPLESILGAIASSAGRWLPGKLLAALASGGNGTASYTASAVTRALYATLAAVGTMMMFCATRCHMTKTAPSTRLRVMLQTPAREPLLISTRVERERFHTLTRARMAVAGRHRRRRCCEDRVSGRPR